MSASQPPLPEPTELAGRFQVIQKLGAGAFGTVFKARDKVLGRLLAIKTIRMEGLAASQAGLAEMLERFRREAQVAAQLKHPGIVTIYDIGESEGVSYISMELIDGIGLDRVIAESGRIPVERAAALAAQVAEALDFAHRAGVVHRDIKPANIMIEAGDRVKVTDFGIAKPSDSAEHLTLTGSLLGTPSYMSPEQARGGALDGRSDLFSLGCVLYEMVAGRKAFRGESITALLFKIITEEPQPIRELDPTLPDSLVQIVAKAIAKAPENRYQSGRELADDLLALVRPGSLPTLRSRDSATLPLAPAGEPTAVSPATDRATQSSVPTLAREPTPARAPAPAPTIRMPGTAGGRPAPAREAAPPSRQLRSAPARRGPGAAVLLGFALVAFLVLAGLGIGAWTLLAARRTAGPAAAAAPAGTTEATPAPAEAPVTTASLQPAAIESPPATVAAEPSATTSAVLLAPTTVAPARSRPTADAGTASADAPEAGGSSFLDEVPAEGPDGRAAGEALAQKYRSGGSGGLSGTRFTRRSRFPARIALPERSAVGTLAHLLSAQEAYQKSNGGYGTLQDLQRAGLLHLDVPFADGAFQRARYRFRLTGAGDEFRATATPLAAGPRPFVVDQSGYIRVDE